MAHINANTEINKIHMCMYNMTRIPIGGGYIPPPRKALMQANATMIPTAAKANDVLHHQTSYFSDNTLWEQAACIPPPPPPFSHAYTQNVNTQPKTLTGGPERAFHDTKLILTAETASRSAVCRDGQLVCMRTQYMRTQYTQYTTTNGFTPIPVQFWIIVHRTSISRLEHYNNSITDLWEENGVS